MDLQLEYGLVLLKKREAMLRLESLRMVSYTLEMHTLKVLSMLQVDLLLEKYTLHLEHLRALF